VVEGRPPEDRPTTLGLAKSTFLIEGAQRKRGVRRGRQPITTSTAPENNGDEFERPTPGKTFAFLRAASAFSAIKVF
jgi:hypothetical protein